MKYVGYITCGLVAAIAVLHLPAGCHLATRYNQHLERRIDKAFGYQSYSSKMADELANDIERLQLAKESPWRRVESGYLNLGDHK